MAAAAVAVCAKAVVAKERAKSILRGLNEQCTRTRREGQRERRRARGVVEG